MTKRIFAVVIAIAMVCTMFAFVTSAAETTTVNLDSSVTAHGWNQILNAINFNDFDHDEDGWKQVAEAQNLCAILLYGTTLDGWAVNTEEPWNSVLYLKCKVVDLINAGIAWNGEAPAADVLVCDYMQNTFGYVAYALRGGKQRAVDLWNSYCSEPVALDGDNAFTYTNNTTYTDESFNAALACLKAYMTYAQDNQVCNVGTTGRWTAQKARYASLENALKALEVKSTGSTLVDFTGVTTSDATLTYLIGMYNNVDVESYKANEDVQNWAKAIKEGIEAGKGSSEISVGSANVVDLWEQNIRYLILLNMGARTAADNVMNDNTLWPGGTAITDMSQTTYVASQYKEVYDLWVKIRDEYKSSTTIKTSEVIAACESLKAKIQALEVANLKFTAEQKAAALPIFDKNFSAYGSLLGMSALEIYQQRIARVTLDSNKATDTYKNYVALVAEAEAIAALDWENGTSESYPSVAEIQALLAFSPDGWIVSGQIEDDWHPFRLAFGLDNAGYDSLVNATYEGWVASGLYSETSLAEVKAKIDNFEAANLSGNRGSNNTDAGVQEDIEYYQAFLVSKPQLVDFTGVTTPDATLTYLITMYNNVDVESIKADAGVQNWAKAIKEGIEAGLGNESINVGSTNVVSLWETTIRYTVKLNAGARTAADEVMNNNSLWPLGAAIADLNQTIYKTAQYNEVYNLWVQIRDDYRSSTTIKTSEVIAACESLKAKIQALEVASYKFTQEQKDAYSVLKVYVPIYRGRVERVVLDSNKATDIYKNYVALVVKAEGYLALDWENGTSESYPSVEEMHALIMPEAMGGSLENDWYPFRQAFGLDNNGYDTLLNNTYTAWVKSGKYTEASLADVKARIDNFEAANLSGNRGSNNTDAGAQEDIEYYQAFLVEKPALPVFKIASANLLITDSISINFKVNKNVYEGYNNVYAVIECNGETVTITNPTYHEEDNQRYYFTFSGIGPQMMKDDVNITLYGTANGEEYTNSVSYSVYRFCTRQIANNTSDAAYCKVLTDLLNYGAAAQVYVGYKTDDLANAGIDQSYASDTLAEPVSQLNLTYATIENPIVAWKSAALYFESRVSPRLQIQADDITGLYVKFVIDGVEYVVDTFEPREGYTDRYYVTFEGVSPTMMRSAFTATVYKDGVAVSNTLQYSIQTYVVGKTVSDGGINDLLIAMLKFGDSCAAYGN